MYRAFEPALITNLLRQARIRSISSASSARRVRAFFLFLERFADHLLEPG